MVDICYRTVIVTKCSVTGSVHTGMFIHSFIHSFIPLFSVYPYTGKTKDVEMVIIDVNVSVRRTNVKWLNTIIIIVQ